MTKGASPFTFVLIPAFPNMCRHEISRHFSNECDNMKLIAMMSLEITQHTNSDLASKMPTLG